MPVYDIYVSNGLTAISNLEEIMPRDSAGNILLDASNTSNTNLIIETVTEKYTKRSVVNALPTAFSYFSFPVAENVPPQDIIIDTDFDGILPELPDPVFARYRPSTNYILPRTGGSVSGIEFSTVEVGVQPRLNQYLITKEIVELNIPLRFRLRFTVNNTGTGGGLFRASIIKNDTRSGSIRNYIPGARSGNLNAYWPTGGLVSPIIPAGSSYTFEIEEIIQPSEFIRGTVFQIAAAQNSQANLVIDSTTTYWIISDATQNVNEFGEPN
jgi:hypothetical protein